MKVMLDLKELPVRLDCKDPKELLEPKELWVLLEQLVLQDQLELQDNLEFLDCKVHPDSLG